MKRLPLTLPSENVRHTFASKVPVVALLIVFSLATTSLWAAVFIVTSTANSGVETLRQAITDANASADPSSEIRFQSGLGEIVIDANLPAISKPLKIDGYYYVPSAMGINRPKSGLKYNLDDVRFWDGPVWR